MTIPETPDLYPMVLPAELFVRVVFAGGITENGDELALVEPAALDWANKVVPVDSIDAEWYVADRELDPDHAYVWVSLRWRRPDGMESM